MRGVFFVLAFLVVVFFRGFDMVMLLVEV